jgi:hypothetical protein
MDIKEFKAENIHQKENIHPWESARYQVVWDLIKSYLKPEKTFTAADIGCGDLFFLNQLASQRQGNYIAIDTAFTPEMMQELNAKYPLKNIKLCADLKELDALETTIDIVFLMDVLEHIENDETFFEHLSNQSFINTDTLFIITVPAFQKLFSQHDIWLGHYRRYHLKDLYKIAQKQDFKILKSGYFFTFLCLARYLQTRFSKLKNQNYKKQEGVANWKHGFGITQLFKTVLMIDYYIFGKFLKFLKLQFPGLSTYIICKKQV